MSGINKKIMEQFFYRKGVVGIGLGIRACQKQKRERKALVVFVEKKEKEEKGEEILPQEIGDYAVDVIEVGQLKLMRKVMLRPAPPGCSIGHYRISAGTLGAIVKDRISQELLVLSNNHVLANLTNGRDGKAKIGDFILQPGVYDGGKIPQHVLARLWRYAPILTEKPLLGCKVLKGAHNYFRQLTCKLSRRRKPKSCFPQENLVDAAVAKPVNKKYLSPYILGLGKIRGVAEAQVGGTIRFSGRSSGVQQAEVLAVASTFRVKVAPGSYAVFSDQFVTRGISQPGDSGALAINDNKEAVGMLFAGSEEATIFNSVQNVFASLDVILA